MMLYMRPNSLPPFHQKIVRFHQLELIQYNKPLRTHCRFHTYLEKYYQNS